MLPGAALATDPACYQELWLGRPPERRAVRTVRAAQAGAGARQGGRSWMSASLSSSSSSDPMKSSSSSEYIPQLGSSYPAPNLQAQMQQRHISTRVHGTQEVLAFILWPSCLLVMVRMPCSSSNECQFSMGCCTLQAHHNEQT